MKLFRVIRRWFLTRNLARLPYALPAMVMCLGGIVFTCFVAGWSLAHTEALYRDEARRALGRRDYETARVAYQRLMGLRNERFNEYTFNLALSLAGLERQNESATLINLMTPLDGRGYAPAHLFVARNLIAQTNAPPSSLRQAEAHLLSVVAAEPGNLDAHELLARIYLSLGLWDAARKHLAEVVPQRGEMALLMANTYRAKGDEAAARAWADRAVAYLSSRVGQNQVDDPAARLAWAEGLVLLGRYEPALRLLENAAKQYGNPVYGQAIGEVCHAWVANLARETPQDMSTRLRLVQQGLAAAPQNLGLLGELVRLGRLPEPEMTAARAAINRMLAQGGDTSVLHFVLGSDAWTRGQKAEARQHFLLAFNTAPHLPFVANNMAMILATDRNPELDRALSIIQPLVEKFPANPSFRDTRGRILLRQARYEEAIKDLEFSLPQVADKAAAHLALAEAYEKLGLKTAAAEHARLGRPETARSPPPR